MNEKSLRIRYHNSKLQILDNEVPGGKVTIDDAKGYVPSKNHTFLNSMILMKRLQFILLKILLKMKILRIDCRC